MNDCTWYINRGVGENFEEFCNNSFCLRSVLTSADWEIETGSTAGVDVDVGRRREGFIFGWPTRTFPST